MQKIKKLIHYLLAHGAYWWYGRPARKIITVGVTGTKGKSTTCRYIASVLEAGGFKVGLLSTVEFQIGTKRWLNDRKMTMLGRGQIQKMLRQMVKAGCQYAVVETSSEGILQYRHIGIDYDIAVFTNLGTEHQERHGGFENLKRDKGKMFAELVKRRRKIINNKRIDKSIIVNADDAQAKYYAHFSADAKWSYGFLPHAALPGVTYINAVLKSANEPIEFTIDSTSYHINQPGTFNAYNALAAVAVGQSQHIKTGDILAGLISVQDIPGRMEFINEGQNFKVVVDYAHERLSYQALFSTLRALVKPANGRVIGIIGSDGGGRDVQKRPDMGQIAGTLCDIVIVTDVNCFDEDPLTIAQMLAAGSREAGKKDAINLHIEVDRRKAIALAFSLAKAGDVVAITAKGTEPVLCVANGKKIPWDDRVVAREELAKLR